MTKLDIITNNAFKLTSMATANEAHIAKVIRLHELEDDHRARMPSSPDRSKIERQSVQRVAEAAVLKFLKTCPDGISTQRVIQSALSGIVRPSSVENALRNLNGAAGFIHKHVSSTGNRNWYELTDKGREL